MNESAATNNVFYLTDLSSLLDKRVSLLRELGLPAGCILVRSSIDGDERVVTASTRLVPHMSITAIISPEATDALEILRRGCTG